MGVIKFKSNGMSNINVAKQRVQNQFPNKSTSDLTLLVDFYGCYMQYSLKTESLSTKLFVLLLGLSWSAAGDMR